MFSGWQRTDRHVAEPDANLRRKQCRRKVTLSPSEQDPLDLTPFNVTDGAWVKGLRDQVCGALAPWNRGRVVNAAAVSGGAAAEEECVVVKLQGHWEHWGLFYRYREFIKVLGVVWENNKPSFPCVAFIVCVRGSWRGPCLTLCCCVILH